MNILLSCVGKRGYIADYFRPHLGPGDHIIGTSNTEWTPGFAACDLGLLMPPIFSDEYIPAVLEACRRYEIAGLLSLFDPDVLALSSRLDDLRAVGVTPFIPEAAGAAMAFDKWLTHETLRSAGFSVPDTTISLEEAHLGLETGRFRFPLIVKPRKGFGSANVFNARNALQLEAFFSYADGMLIQEFEDGDAYNIEAFADTKGEVLQVVAWRKFLSRLGETERAVTVSDGELMDVGRRLARTVGLVGPMDVDLFRTRQGEVRVLELNLRFGGGYPVSHRAGADFPGMMIDILKGRRPEPRIGQYLPGVCLMKTVQPIGGPTDTFFEALLSGRMQSQSSERHFR